MDVYCLTFWRERECKKFLDVNLKMEIFRLFLLSSQIPKTIGPPPMSNFTAYYKVRIFH